jgi:hypothetical protein
MRSLSTPSSYLDELFSGSLKKSIVSRINCKYWRFYKSMRYISGIVLCDLSKRAMCSFDDRCLRFSSRISADSRTMSFNHFQLNLRRLLRSLILRAYSLQLATISHTYRTNFPILLPSFITSFELQ